MIEKIILSNYKAFLNAELKIKPITILLGSNSSGKSSLLQFILMIQQSLNIYGDYAASLKLNGKSVRLGEDENLLFNRNLDKKLAFEITIKPSNLHRRCERIIREHSREVISIYRRLFETVKMLDIADDKSPKSNLLRDTRTNTRTIDVDFRDELLNKEIPRLKRKLRKLLRSPEVHEQISIINEKNKNTDRRFISELDHKDSITELTNIELKPYIKSFELLDLILSTESRIHHIGYELGYNKKTNKLQIEGISIKDYKGNYIFKLYKEPSARGDIYQLESDYVDGRILDQNRNKFKQALQFSGLSTGRIYDSRTAPHYLFEDSTKYVNPFVKSLVFVCDNITTELSKMFDDDSINYIGPLRAFPERYYFLDEGKRTRSVDSGDGNSVAELLKRNKSAENKVNKWLKKFGLKVNVEDFKDIIHKIKVSQNSLKLDITDVGFGISQLLPIIVQGVISQRGSINLIEQPEIHLHPKLQAELADLFIDLLYEEGTNRKSRKSFIIETHSEYFLKRLRRRMSEKTKIDSDDVAIYFVHQRSSFKTGAKLERVEISESGAFAWPDDYYTNDIDDTLEFLKNQ